MTAIPLFQLEMFIKCCVNSLFDKNEVLWKFIPQKAFYHKFDIFFILDELNYR